MSSASILTYLLRKKIETDDVSLSVRYKAHCNGTTKSIIMCIDGVLSRETTLESTSLGLNHVLSSASVGLDRVLSREVSVESVVDIDSALFGDKNFESGEGATPLIEAGDAKTSDTSATTTEEGPTARYRADKQEAKVSKKPTRSVGYNREGKRVTGGR